MESRTDPGRLLWGIVLVALGLLFLAGNFGYRVWFVGDRWWPLLLIAVGVILLLRQRAEGHTAPPVAPSGAPGQSVASASPPGISPGPGAHVPGAAAPETPVARAKRFPTGAVILIGLGVAFLLDDVVGGNAFPALALIAVGVALLLRQRAAS